MKQLLKCITLVAAIAAVTTLGTGTAPKATVNRQPSGNGGSTPSPSTKKVKADLKPAPTKIKPSPPILTYPARCQTYLPLIKKYDWDVNVAFAIMNAESKCNASAISPPNYDGLRDYGLMQIHGVEILNASQNVAYAYYHKYLPAHGWTPWTTYTSGRYLNYLR